MAQRFDVCSPRQRKDSEKTFWHRCGTAWKSDKGTISVVFDSLPLPDKDGRVSVTLFEPREKTQPAQGAQKPNDDMDDQIPF